MVNKALTILVEHVPVFTDPVDKFVEILFRTIFSLAGPALQPAMVLILVCQTLGQRTRLMRRDPSFRNTNYPFVELLYFLSAALLCRQVSGCLPSCFTESPISEHAENSLATQVA